jgi:Ca2+-binding EF-hand superfamily protein
MHIFEIFCKKSGFISYADLKKIIDLIDFAITEKQFELLCMYADEEGQQNIHAYELAQQIENAEVVAPQFDIQKWIIASRELVGRHHLLALVYDVLP